MIKKDHVTFTFDVTKLLTMTYLVSLVLVYVIGVHHVRTNYFSFSVFNQVLAPNTASARASASCSVLALLLVL